MSNQTQTNAGVLSQAQIEHYQRDGFVVVEQLYSDSEALEWKAILKKRLVEEGKLDEPSGVRVWMPESMDSYTQSKVLDGRVVAVLQQLVGPNVEFLSVKAVFKNAKTNFNSPWHQDWFYWQGTNKISAWIALDDATPENGCLRMVPGSHHRHFTMRNVEDGHGFNRRVTDEDLAGLPIETVPIRRGGAIFFHDLALHASCPNSSGQERWSAIATYRDASQKDDSTVWQEGIVLSGESVN